MNEEIDILLSRYFSGEATEKELHSLDIWLSKSNENEKLFHEMTLLYQHAGQANDLSAIDTEKALTQFKNYTEKGERRREKREKVAIVYFLMFQVFGKLLLLLLF